MDSTEIIFLECEGLCTAAGPGVAGDMVKTGTCLLGKCQVHSHQEGQTLFN